MIIRNSCRVTRPKVASYQVRSGASRSEQRRGRGIPDFSAFAPMPCCIGLFRQGVDRVFGRRLMSCTPGGLGLAC